MFDFTYFDISFYVYFIANVLSYSGNILALIGLAVSHRKWFPLDFMCYFLNCFSQILISILADPILNISLFIPKYTYFIVNTNSLLTFQSFLILIISYNRVYLMVNSYIYKKKSSINSKNKSFCTIYFKIIMAILILFIICFLVNIPIIWENLITENSYKPTYSFYFVFIRSVIYFVSQTLLTLNYLVIIPFIIIRYNKGKISKSTRRNTIVSVKLAIFSFLNFISFSIYAYTNLMNRMILLANLLYLISSLVYGIEPFVLILFHKTITRGLKIAFLKCKQLLFIYFQYIIKKD